MSIELPPLPELLRVYTIDGAKYVDGGAFADWFGIQVERERILLDRIAELEAEVHAHTEAVKVFEAANAELESQRDYLVEEYERAVKCGKQGYLHCAMHLFNAIFNARVDAVIAAKEKKE